MLGLSRKADQPDNADIADVYLNCHTKKSAWRPSPATTTGSARRTHRSKPHRSKEGAGAAASRRPGAVQIAGYVARGAPTATSPTFLVRGKIIELGAEALLL